MCFPRERTHAQWKCRGWVISKTRTKASSSARFVRVSTRQENENKKKTSVPRSLNHRESQKSFNWICLYGPSFNSCTVIFSFLFSLFSSKSLKSPWVQLTQLIIPLREKRAPSNGYGKEWRSWYLQKRFLISQSCVRNANGDSFGFSFPGAVRLKERRQRWKRVMSSRWRVRVHGGQLRVHQDKQE